MLFALGYIAGVTTCAFIATMLILLRKPLQQIAGPIVQAVENAAVRPRGFVVEPLSDADVARSERIQENNERGVDTRIEELL